jgi:hypothetical protein
MSFGDILLKCHCVQQGGTRKPEKPFLGLVDLDEMDKVLLSLTKRSPEWQKCSIKISYKQILAFDDIL